MVLSRAAQRLIALSPKLFGVLCQITGCGSDPRVGD
jgi:hypothetical protein